MERLRGRGKVSKVLGGRGGGKERGKALGAFSMDPGGWFELGGFLKPLVPNFQGFSALRAFFQWFSKPSA